MSTFSFLSLNRLFSGSAPAKADKVDRYAKGGFTGAELNEILAEYKQQWNVAGFGGLEANGFDNYKDTLKARHPVLMKYLEHARLNSRDESALREGWSDDSSFSVDTARKEDFDKFSGR